MKLQGIKLFRYSVSCLLGGLTLLGGTLSSCNSIDCPLDNVVVCTYGLYDTSGASLTLPSTTTLTITLPNRSVTLLNQATSISSFTLPVSYAQETDTLLLQFATTAGTTATDTLIYEKTNAPHFENLSCPASIFHTIKSVRWSSHSLTTLPLTIDSVAISRATVNYDDVENIKIYLRSE